MSLSRTSLITGQNKIRINKVQNINKPTIQYVLQKTSQKHSHLPQDIIKHDSPKLNFEDIFDQMVDNMQVNPIYYSIENAFAQFFDTKSVTAWIYNSKNETFFSPSNQKSVYKGTGIISLAASEKNFIQASPQSLHSSYDSSIDSVIYSGESSIIDFPIIGRDNEVFYIVQVSFPKRTKPFGADEGIIANKLFSKFRLFGDFLFPGNTVLSLPMSFEISDSAVISVCNSLRSFFKCEHVDFYVYRSKFSHYLHISDQISTNYHEIVSEKSIGCAFHCFKSNTVLNTCNVKNSEYYNPIADGDRSQAVVAGVFVDSSDQKWVCILRSPIVTNCFSIIDQKVLSAVIPFASRALSFLFSPPEMDKELDQFEHRLKALLEVAENLSGVLDIDTLLPTIMDRACSLLNAERCSLFLVDSSKKELVTRIHGGLENAIRVKIGRGIVGNCAQTGVIVNIRDAYADPRFDRSVDLATGFTTRSLLCVPIYNNRGEINGVTEMINKKNSGLFDEDDEKMLMAFNVFCGISLDNARLYKASLDLTKQLRSFIQMSTALSQNDTEERNLKDILDNIMAIVKASRVSLFLADEIENTLSLHLNIGETGNYGTMFAQEAASNRRLMLFDHKDVLGRTQTEQLNAAIDRILAAGLDADVLVFGRSDFGQSQEEDPEGEEDQDYVSEYYDDQPDNEAYVPVESTKSSIIEQTKPRQSFLPNLGQSRLVKTENKTTESYEVICCLPLINNENAVLGVIEISCGWKILGEDVKLLDCFAVFAAFTIERSQLKNRANLGQVEFELKNWISEKERTAVGQIPTKLLIGMDKLSQVLMIKFDAPEWDGIGLFKVVFAIFDLFDIMTTFGVSNEKLFKFLSEVKNKYKKVPYHNWRHAVDVMQFVSYEVLVGNLDSTLTKNEIFGLLIASLCHDLDHDGFSNIFNVKAETPLGILFKNQSVMETHHCAEAITILSVEDTNLFSNLSSHDYKSMWNLIIQLILATDMAKHFDIIATFNDKVDSNQFSMDNPNDKLLFLQMLIKCGDVSNVSRPFEMANKWCDDLCEEFFRQGDLEQTAGMEYTSPLNDREHLNKPKSQIGFYDAVCLPMFQAVAKVAPRLSVNVNQVESNLHQWKESENTNK